MQTFFSNFSSKAKVNTGFSAKNYAQTHHSKNPSIFFLTSRKFSFETKWSQKCLKCIKKCCLVVYMCFISPKNPRGIWGRGCYIEKNPIFRFFWKFPKWSEVVSKVSQVFQKMCFGDIELGLTPLQHASHRLVRAGSPVPKFLVSVRNVFLTNYAAILLVTIFSPPSSRNNVFGAEIQEREHSVVIYRNATQQFKKKRFRRNLGMKNNI